MKQYILTIKFVLFFLPFLANAQFGVLSPGIQINSIQDVEYGAANKMIFATDNGIVIHENGSWKNFSTADGLTNNNVVAIEPYSGGFMYSTEGTRIGACDYNGIIYDKDARSSGHPYQTVTAIHLNNSDTLYGTDIGSVFLSNTTSNGFSSTPVSSSFSTQLGAITAINQLQGSLDYHVITSMDKIMIYQISSGTTFPVSTPLLPSNVVLSNAVQGTTTYDGTDNGVYIYNFVDPKTEINTSNSPIPSNVINAIAVDGTSLFLGTPDGLAVRVNNKWETFTSTNSNLPSSDISHIAVEKSTNKLWVTTKQGDICNIDVNKLPTAIKAINDKVGLKIFPNPATSDVLHIDHSEDISRDATYTISNILGKDIQSGKLSNVIDITSIPTGNYILTITSNQIAAVRKITIIQ